MENRKAIRAHNQKYSEGHVSYFKGINQYSDMVIIDFCLFIINNVFVKCSRQNFLKIILPFYISDLQRNQKIYSRIQIQQEF